MTASNIQLVSAIFANDASKIKVLREEGVDVNECGFFNIPPLLRAALYGKSEALIALLECGADKAAKDKKGRTALELAQKHNHRRIVEILSEN